MEIHKRDEMKIMRDTNPLAREGIVILPQV
jgi:hypothetical protein